MDWGRVKLGPKDLENVSDEYKSAVKDWMTVRKAECVSIGLGLGEETKIDMVGLFEVGPSGQFSSAVLYFDSAKAKALASLAQ